MSKYCIIKHQLKSFGSLLLWMFKKICVFIGWFFISSYSNSSCGRYSRDVRQTSALLGNVSCDAALFLTSLWIILPSLTLRGLIASDPYFIRTKRTSAEVSQAVRTFQGLWKFSERDVLLSSAYIDSILVMWKLTSNDLKRWAAPNRHI